MEKLDRTGLYTTINLPKKFWEMNLSDTTGYEKILEKDLTKRGVYLYGSHGIGKTTFCCLYFKNIVDKILDRMENGERVPSRERQSVRITTLHNLIELYIKRHTEDYKINGVDYRFLEEADLVLVDDIEDAYLENNAKEMASSVLNHFIRERFNQNKLTWITSNCSPEELIAHFGLKKGVKLVDFLYEACYIVNKTGTNFRNNQKTTDKI